MNNKLFSKNDFNDISGDHYKYRLLIVKII